MYYIVSTTAYYIVSTTTYYIVSTTAYLNLQLIKKKSICVFLTPLH